MTKQRDGKTAPSPIGPSQRAPQIEQGVRLRFWRPNIAEFVAAVNLDAPQISIPGRYFAAIMFVVIAAVVRLLLRPILNFTNTFVTFFPAIVFTAWVGGWWPGVFATALSGLVASYLWLEPVHSLAIVRPDQQLSFLLFLAAGLAVSALGEAQLRHRDALAHREAQYRGFLEAANEGVMMVDGDGRITYMNPAGAKLLEATREQVLGTPVFDFFFAEDLEDVHRHWQNLRRGNSEECDARIQRRNSSMFWAHFNGTPIYENGRFVGTLCMVTDVTERKKAEADMAFSLRREALLNKITATLRDTTDADRIQFVAVRELGIALRADRAFFRAYDLSGARSWGGEDYHREDLPSVSGVYSTETYGLRPSDVYGDRRTLVVSDLEDSGWPEPLLQALRSNRVRSLVSTPLFEGETLVGTLTVAMADIRRRWTDDEVALVEVVAGQTRAALESARAREREHRIATELQQSLQPPVPTRTPGLNVAAIMRPAWDEAEVGGDFYDVFPLDADRTALIVGDVSGKGLAAAAQLATVRNCLRSTLYLTGMLGDALESASRVLTASDLTGFVTAFVSVYNTGDGTLSYVACGHDPGIIRRVDGTTELLGRPGPPLGVAGMPQYEVDRIILGPGDTLVLYTDGLTESGVSRQELLGSNGLAKLVAALPQDLEPRCLGEAIISATSARSGGTFHDDVCLLIATRSD